MSTMSGLDILTWGVKANGYGRILQLSATDLPNGEKASQTEGGTRTAVPLQKLEWWMERRWLWCEILLRMWNRCCGCETVPRSYLQFPIPRTSVWARKEQDDLDCSRKPLQGKERTLGYRYIPTNGQRITAENEAEVKISLIIFPRCDGLYQSLGF